MFHAIGKTVNAPSKVLLARSRSRQEDAEGILKLFGEVFSDLHHSAIRDGTGQGVTGLHGNADGL
jgi:hypothetical protein